MVVSAMAYRILLQKRLHSVETQVLCFFWFLVHLPLILFIIFLVQLLANLSSVSADPMGNSSQSLFQIVVEFRRMLFPSCFFLFPPSQFLLSLLFLQ
jgi:hypothetical protein